MYVTLGDGTWLLVWKIVFLPDGIAKLWIGSHQFVAIAGTEAETLRVELAKQDPIPGRRLVWTETEQEEVADVPHEADEAVAGRIGYRCGGVGGT